MKIRGIRGKESEHGGLWRSIMQYATDSPGFFFLFRLAERRMGRESKGDKALMSAEDVGGAAGTGTSSETAVQKCGAGSWR